MLREYAPPVAASKAVGHHVWIIQGQFKGFRATLRALNPSRSLVSFSNRTMEIENRFLATKYVFLFLFCPCRIYTNYVTGRVPF